MDKIVERVPFVNVDQLKRKRVAAYARVSCGKDAMLHSLSAQVSYYSNLIQKNVEWEYCGVYADEALTGTKEDRTNFQRLLADCRAGKIDIVITKSISRFARNTVTLLETVRELRELGIDVFFEEQNIHTLSSEGELLLTLLASFAQAESLSASENMKWRIRKGFENGELMGLRHMFGYDISKGRITVNEEEAEIIRTMFSKFLEGESLGAIARWLKANHVAGALGGKIRVTEVRQILGNEKYTGNALLQKTYMNNHLEKKKTKNTGELPMYYVEGSHEAIIDQDTFNRVQDRLKQISDAAATRSPMKHTVFTSRIRCEQCGANYVRAYNRKPVWQCSTYRYQGREKCYAKQIPEELLERLTCEVLGTDKLDEDLFKKRIAAISANNDSEGNILTFTLTTGETIVKRWENPSRSKSWTPEMREKARENGRKKGGRKDV